MSETKAAAQEQTTDALGAGPIASLVVEFEPKGLSDVEIQVDNTRFLVHKLMVSGWSSVMRTICFETQTGTSST